MWKLIVGFVVFAGLAMFVLMRGGDIDLSGEKHGPEAEHAASPAVPGVIASPAAGSETAGAASAAK